MRESWLVLSGYFFFCGLQTWRCLIIWHTFRQTPNRKFQHVKLHRISFKTQTNEKKNVAKLRACVRLIHWQYYATPVWSDLRACVVVWVEGAHSWMHSCIASWQNVGHGGTAAAAWHALTWEWPKPHSLQYYSTCFHLLPISLSCQSSSIYILCLSHQLFICFFEYPWASFSLSVSFHTSRSHLYFIHSPLFSLISLFVIRISAVFLFFCLLTDAEANCSKAFRKQIVNITNWHRVHVLKFINSTISLMETLKHQNWMGAYREFGRLTLFL